MSLATIVIFGALSASFALLLEIGILSLGDITTPTFVAPRLSDFFTLFAASLIEEFSKFLFLLQYTRRFFATLSPSLWGMLLLGLLFGIGFSIPEFALALSTSPDSLLPLVGIMALHIVTSMIIATLVLYRRSRSLIELALFLGSAVALHFLYNFIVSSRSV